MNQIQKTKIEIPVYETTVEILYAKNNLEYLFDYMGKDNYEEHKHCDAVTFKYLSKGHICIMLTDLKLRTIIHECFHVTTALLEFRDIHLDNSSTEEVYAYLNAYITTEVLTKVKKWGKISYIN